ncbi:hypothetical protein [Candidatus Spongiihabitans sp.]|uniref:hypothetical protein n=1 Tax=Candidatus Spongiihabitans sp. TaxID=3101308 RepID=UPI003C7CD0DB
MRALVFGVGIWDEYEKLRRKDKGTHDKLCLIIKQLLRNPDAGSGKAGLFILNVLLSFQFTIAYHLSLPGLFRAIQLLNRSA